MPLKRVFLVGAPRSGTSILLDVMSAQPDFAWIPLSMRKNPEHFPAAAKNRMYDIPLLGDFWFERRYWRKKLPAPLETSEFWDHFLPASVFREDQPSLFPAEALTEEGVERCREALREIQARQCRELFLGHLSGPSRVAMLRRVFPDAVFIQTQRDPRSVAIYLSMRIKHRKQNDPLWENRAQWRELMPETLRQRLDALPDTPLNFAGVMVRWWHTQYRHEMRELPESDRLSLAYADLMAKPEETLKRALRFLGLKEAPRLKRYLKYHSLQNSNSRMNKELPGESAAQLEMAVAKLPE